MSDVAITPDGIRYVAAAQVRVPRPFHYRWLLPKLCGNRERWWTLQAHLATWAMLPAIWWYIGGLRGLAAAAMVTGLSGAWKFNRRHVVLVDSAGMALALLSADCLKHHLWPVAIAVVVVAACVRETSPVFAALFAWNPLLLIGLLPVAVRQLQHEGPDVLDAENRWILDHQVKASWKYHKGLPFIIWFLPWGGALVALAHISPQLALTVAVAYGQCLIATDTVRLYQWCWPVMLASAVYAVPMRWLPVLVVLTIANPFDSQGG